MGWSIEWLEIARDDLREIVEFIAKDNPDKAIEEGSLIISKIEDLENLPDRGSRFREYDQWDLYQIFIVNTVFKRSVKWSESVGQKKDAQ